ncbi:MAG TPA: DciA family protein [Methylotenera sp.]|nr:DciA family protein [Methylotenera sp.]
MRQFNALLKQPELNALTVRNQETQAAQEIWVTIAPDNLAKFSHASSIKNQQLTIFADNNAVAAKIKLFIPNLLIKLNSELFNLQKKALNLNNQILNSEKQVHEVTSIRVKVQVKSAPQTKPKAIKKLSAQAATDLNQLAEKLAGTALGDALARLATKAD